MQTQEYIYLNSIYFIFDSETKYHKFNLNKPTIAHGGNNIQIRLPEAEIPLSYYNTTAGINDSIFLGLLIQEIIQLIMISRCLRKIMMLTKWIFFK